MTTEQNLGDVLYIVHAPEEAIKPKTGAATNLILLLPSVVAGGAIGLLMSKNEKMSSAAVWGVSIGIFLVIAGLTAWIQTRWSKRYAEQVLEIRERGISGVHPGGPFKSMRFSIPYTALRRVEGKRDAITVRTDTDFFVMLAEDAEENAAKLRQIGNIQ